MDFPAFGLINTLNHCLFAFNSLLQFFPIFLKDGLVPHTIISLHPKFTYQNYFLLTLLLILLSFLYMVYLSHGSSLASSFSSSSEQLLRQLLQQPTARASFIQSLLNYYQCAYIFLAFMGCWLLMDLDIDYIVRLRVCGVRVWLNSCFGLACWINLWSFSTSVRNTGSSSVGGTSMSYFAWVFRLPGYGMCSTIISGWNISLYYSLRTRSKSQISFRPASLLTITSCGLEKALKLFRMLSKLLKMQSIINFSSPSLLGLKLQTITLEIQYRNRNKLGLGLSLLSKYIIRVVGVEQLGIVGELRISSRLRDIIREIYPVYALRILSSRKLLPIFLVPSILAVVTLQQLLSAARNSWNSPLTPNLPVPLPPSTLTYRYLPPVCPFLLVFDF